DALSRRRARLPVLAGRAPESPRRCRPATLNYSTPPPFGCAFASDTGLWGPCCARFPGVRGPLRPGGGPLVFGWLHRSRHALREGHRRGGQTTRGDGRHGGPEAAYPLSSGTVNEAAWAITAATSGCSWKLRACRAAIFSASSGSSESETSVAANFSRSGVPSSSSCTCAGWVRYAQ